jgi:hypothetical protein
MLCHGLCWTLWVHSEVTGTGSSAWTLGCCTWGSGKAWSTHHQCCQLSRMAVIPETSSLWGLATCQLSWEGQADYKGLCTLSTMMTDGGQAQRSGHACLRLCPALHL